MCDCSISERLLELPEFESTVFWLFKISMTGRGAFLITPNCQRRGGTGFEPAQEALNENWFLPPEDTAEKVEPWRIPYNEEDPTAYWENLFTGSSPHWQK